MRSILVAVLLVALAPSVAAAKADPFPQRFVFGVAQSGFQTEMGGTPANADTRSDWWAWTHDAANIAAGRVTADKPERGPGAWRRWRQDVDLAARELHTTGWRMSVEWSRLFPTAGGPIDRRAVAHYRAVLRRARARGMTTFVTLSHFALPRWFHDPIAVRDALAGRGGDDPLPPLPKAAGWLRADAPAIFGAYADKTAAALGDLVDVWAPINEPLVVATFGYANVPGVFGGFHPPGAFSFTAAIRAVETMAAANRRAYDAVKRRDRTAKVGLVQNMIAFTPADPAREADVVAVQHADWLFNRLFLEAAVKGAVDRNADGAIGDGERDPAAAGKADFIGVNYYFRGRVTGQGASLSSRIPVLDFLPATEYRWAGRPEAPPCPTTCSEFGAELYPEGLRRVLEIAGAYGKPVQITEIGLADGDDSQRPAFLRDHLRVLRTAMADDVADVRAFYHWSLTDNFEWSAGYAPKFGLYRFDPRTLRRTARPSAKLFAKVARTHAVP